MQNTVNRRNLRHKGPPPNPVKPLPYPVRASRLVIIQVNILGVPKRPCISRALRQDFRLLEDRLAGKRIGIPALKFGDDPT